MNLEDLAKELPAHFDLLDRALRYYGSKEFVGLFLGGSLAAGDADLFSDIDLHVVASDDSYLALLQERPAMMRSLGRVLCEWSTYGESQLLCLYETGVVLEVVLHRQGYLGKPRANMKMKILSDPYGQLAAFQAECKSLATGMEIDAEALPLLWQQVWAWLWRGVGQTLRGEVWEGRDYLEFMRDRAIMPLYRTLRQRTPEGYRRLETWAEPAFLKRLEATAAPPDTESVLHSLLATTSLVEELCMELAHTYGLSLPPQPTTVRAMVERLISDHYQASRTHCTGGTKTPDKEMEIPVAQGELASQYSVVKPHTRSYEDPIVVAKGDVVLVGGVDQDWPGWLWCTNKNGKPGWVPERLLNRAGDEAVVTKGYSAMELTVNAGEVVRGSRLLDGWIWCQKDDGQEGWVPAKNLQVLK